MKKYAITVPKVVRYITDPDPRVEWCLLNINGGRSRWTVSGWPALKFEFKREEDAVLFALKWAGYEG